MKKECTCKKLVKDDKVTLISECNLCKKNRRKELKLAIELANKLIELKKILSHVPKYKEGGILHDNKKETIINTKGIFVSVEGKPVEFTQDGNIITINEMPCIKRKSFQELWDILKPKEIIEEMEKRIKEQQEAKEQ